MMMKAFLDWKHITFAHPFYFALLLLIPLMIWLQNKRRRTNPVLRVTTTTGLAKVAGKGKATYRPVMFVLRIIATLMLVISLARPQSTNTTTNSDTEGIDMVMAMDVSGSMLAEDFKPNRMEAAKQTAIDFVSKRPTDRIGLVVFSGESFSMCPITIDHNVLKEQLSQIKTGMMVDGTCIGMGMATAVDRLRSSKSKSKVIILMTDGVNNVSVPISPATALEIVKAYKIKVYTIGVGTHGQAPVPVPTPFGTQKQMMPVEIDEPLLKQVATETGGKYFRATNNQSLQAIYDDIDKLEKTNIEVTSFKHYTELFFPFTMLAIICIVLEMILRYTVFKSIT